jgi:hypothetical protein
MGFALWVKDGIARAEGTHEYRPMGIAVISTTDLFRVRDFRPRRSQVETSDRDFAGYFASIHHLNYFLKRKRHEPKNPNPHHHGGVLSNS